MTTAEMNRRLAGVSPEVRAQVEQMIREGYGAAGISQNAPVTLKQANAIFRASATPKAVRA
jgi:hypothetical protein